MSASSVLTVLIQSLTKLIWKPTKQYVDLTAAGIPKGLEFDIIIIGGGMLPINIIKSQNVQRFLVRNGWLCACFSSFRKPEYSRAPTWIRRKVCLWLFILPDNSPRQLRSILLYLVAGHSPKAVFHVHISNSSQIKNTSFLFIRTHRLQLIQSRSFGLEVCIAHDFFEFTA